jgi:hypothetical protein
MSSHARFLLVAVTITLENARKLKIDLFDGRAKEEMQKKMFCIFSQHLVSGS